MALFKSNPVEPLEPGLEIGYSALCVSWYIDREPGASIEKMFSDGLADLDWDGHARNCTL